MGRQLPQQVAYPTLLVCSPSGAHRMGLLAEMDAELRVLKCTLPPPTLLHPRSPTGTGSPPTSTQPTPNLQLPQHPQHPLPLPPPQPPDLPDSELVIACQPRCMVENAGAVLLGCFGNLGIPEKVLPVPGSARGAAHHHMHLGSAWHAMGVHWWVLHRCAQPRDVRVQPKGGGIPCARGGCARRQHGSRSAGSCTH